jgi:tetraacyldisaccharide 4'-kinase
MQILKDILFYPLSLLYGWITGIRNFLYDTGVLKSTEFHFPVICVGNITVGGTGKTPHTEYIASLLKKDFRVAILSRGYKRKTRDFRIASQGSLVSEIGDEPLQIFRNFPEVLVAVDIDRVDGITTIIEDHPEIDVIILDDGFQHRRLTPGLSILLSDYNRLYYNDHMLPYGNLRENKKNMRRADVILITKTPENISPIERRIIVREVDKPAYQNLFFTSYCYKSPVPVFNNQSEFSEVNNAGIVLVTGIANPLPLKEYLSKNYHEIVHLQYPDHYMFNEKDILDITAAFKDLKSETRYLFTTEKDAVRLREFANIADPIKSAFFYVPIGIRFLNQDQDEFDNLIIDYVRKNRRNNRIS